MTDKSQQRERFIQAYCKTADLSPDYVDALIDDGTTKAGLMWLGYQLAFQPAVAGAVDEEAEFERHTKGMVLTKTDRRFGYAMWLARSYLRTASPSQPAAEGDEAAEWRADAFEASAQIAERYPTDGLAIASDIRALLNIPRSHFGDCRIGICMEELEELKKLEKAATPAPWERHDIADGAAQLDVSGITAFRDNEEFVIALADYRSEQEEQDARDMDFIAAASNALPRLLFSLRASPADDGENRDLALLKAGFMSCVDMGPPTKVKSYDGTHTTTWTWEEPDYPTVLAAFRQQDKQS